MKIHNFEILNDKQQEYFKNHYWFLEEYNDYKISIEYCRFEPRSYFIKHLYCLSIDGVHSWYCNIPIK